METLSLSTPEVTPATTTSDYRVVALRLLWDVQIIDITVRGTNGELKDFRYSGDVATQLMVALNKANLSLKSLQRRFLERLSADGLLVGAVAGVPD